MRTSVLLPLSVAFALGGPMKLARAAPTPPLAASPSAGPVDEQTEFEKGRNAYRAKNFDEADQRFLVMLDPAHGTLHDKVLVKQARMYWAATLVALHHDEDATHLFEIILTEDHDYEPDPLAFPTEVQNAFVDTRKRLRDTLVAQEREQYRRAAERRVHDEEMRQKEAARLKMLEKLAGEAYVTVPHSRWIALLPFGVGQFQNGSKKLGWILLGAEAALVAGGIATVPVYYVELANAKSTFSGNGFVAEQYQDRANTTRIVNLTLYGTLAATVIAGAIQAEAGFVPKETHTEPRAIHDPDVSPSPPQPASPVSFSFGAAPLPGRDGRGVSGGSLSLSATF